MLLKDPSEARANRARVNDKHIPRASATRIPIAVMRYVFYDLRELFRLRLGFLLLLGQGLGIGIGIGLSDPDPNSNKRSSY